MHNPCKATWLLARKQRLLERLREDPGAQERDEIGRLLVQIDTALDLLDEAGPDTTAGKQYAMLISKQQWRKTIIMGRRPSMEGWNAKKSS